MADVRLNLTIVYNTKQYYNWIALNQSTLYLTIYLALSLPTVDGPNHFQLFSQNFRHFRSYSFFSAHHLRKLRPKRQPY